MNTVWNCNLSIHSRIIHKTLKEADEDPVAIVCLNPHSGPKSQPVQAVPDRTMLDTHLHCGLL